jgi:AraC-like DNA-binding protein
MLADPRNRVSEVASAVGFASTDAFRHAFKARQGASPSHWRTVVNFISFERRREA